MLSVDQRFVIVFNGEIYNFVELAEQLKAKGHRFRTTSDTEVLLTGFIEWKTELFNKLNGMWALAIYDTQEQELTLSRDRFGVKPLYTFYTDGVFLFASEAQAIQRLVPGSISPNWDFLLRLSDYDLSVYGEEKTHWNEIKALRPGHFATLDLSTGNYTTRQWYWLNRIDTPSRYADQVIRFREIFEDACRIRLRSDVPVATCLSGGIDSGSIVSTLSGFANPETQRFCKFSHTAFTASFPNSELDETAAAQYLAAEKGMSLKLKMMLPPDSNELEAAIRSCDGPLPALAFYPIWKLYKYIRESGITVTLDGQGADEMLGGYYIGYDAMYGAMEMNRWKYARDLRDIYRELQPNLDDWIEYQYQHARQLSVSVWKQRLKHPFKKALSALRLRSSRQDIQPLAPTPPTAVGQSLQNHSDSLHSVLWKQFFIAPLPFLLHQYDRCSMAHGVECRMPFMDYRLVEYVYSLPIESRIGHGFTKRILRDSVAGVLPEKIRTNRLKTGFNAPFSQWMKGPLREWLLDIAATKEFTEMPGIDALTLRSQIERGEFDSTTERLLWAKVHIAAWLRNSRG